MTGHALRRLAIAVVTVWVAATMAFLLVHLAPGDPAVALGGESGAAGQMEAVARAYGLDRPLWAIYLDWLGRLLHGDLGHSYRVQEAVVTLIIERLPVTLALMLPALALSALLGVALGLWVAASGREQHALVAGLAAVHALPGYVIGHALVLVFALGLGMLPVQGLGDARGLADGLPARLVVFLRHLALPVATLTLVQPAFVVLAVRGRAREELARPYVATARAKGAGRGRVLVHHVLPNLALPILVLVGWRLGVLIGGTAVIETVFALPGLGRLAVTAAIARDHPVVIGIVLTATTAMVVVNLVVDLVAHWIDPRLAEAEP